MWHSRTKIKKYIRTGKSKELKKDTNVFGRYLERGRKQEDGDDENGVVTEEGGGGGEVLGILRNGVLTVRGI